MRTGRFRRRERRIARYAWPAGVGAAGAAWYAADSLRHRRESGHGYTLRGEVDVRDETFLRAAESLTGAPVSFGNDVELLINGDRIFPAYLGAIKDAEETVNMLTYAYWRGEIAIEVAETLCDKASAGVECNVILDAVGAAKMDRKLVKKMREAGVQVCFFRPPKPYAVKRLQHRTHRKLLIVDGKVGFTGGVGIAEEWTGNAQDPDHWRDTHVRVRGPVVRGLQGAFAENWLECTGDVLAGDRYLPYIEEVEGGGAMQVTRSSATIGDTNAEALVYLALAAAKRSIELTSAYFVPRPAFADALVEAAERGVDMRILVPGSHIDKEFVRTAGRAAYDELIEAGIKIYEYCPTMLHAKSLTVDGVWASVGSVNFDNRSFQLHDEVSLCVQSERFAGELHRQFEKDLEVSERIDPDGWAARPVSQRARERITKFARREL
ncbi:MAG TPA: phospholipase D-like domain-containing protein [Thermoleophilaceae bacterium]|nr:phospholipase D-like domain-containing protein [Thermoleophilaceae bacterium]